MLWITKKQNYTSCRYQGAFRGFFRCYARDSGMVLDLLGWRLEEVHAPVAIAGVASGLDLADSVRVASGLVLVCSVFVAAASLLTGRPSVAAEVVVVDGAFPVDGAVALRLGIAVWSCTGYWARWVRHWWTLIGVASLQSANRLQTAVAVHRWRWSQENKLGMATWARRLRANDGAHWLDSNRPRKPVGAD